MFRKRTCPPAAAGAQVPCLNDVQMISYDAQMISYDVQMISYDVQMISYDAQMISMARNELFRAKPIANGKTHVTSQASFISQSLLISSV